MSSETEAKHSLTTTECREQHGVCETQRGADTFPASWARTTLQNIGDLFSGGTPKTSNPDNFDGEISWITPADLTGYDDVFIGRGRRNLSKAGLKSCSAKLMPEGTVLFSSRAPIGYAAIASNPICTNQGFKNVAPAVGIGSKYVYYYLKSAKELAESKASGTTFKELSGSRFAQLPIPIAPENEQHRIVEKIETLFARIDKGEEALREVQKLLKRYRQSILKAAVTGELTRDWREANKHKLEPASDLLARILETRQAKWQGRGKYKEPTSPESVELSEPPEDWTWATVDQVTSLFKNGLSKKPVSDPNDLPILRISAVRPMSVSLEDLRYYPLSEEADIDAFWVEQGDLLFTRYSGSTQFVGVCGQLRDDIKVLHPDKLIKARPVSVAGLNTDYLELAWNTGWTRKHIAANIKTTSGQQGIAGADIKMAPFPLPPSEEQAIVAQRVQEAMERIDSLESACESELTRSTALRQSILKSAFTGQLVPQDPNDEPASELLARIRAECEAKPKAIPRRKAGT